MTTSRSALTLGTVSLLLLLAQPVAAQVEGLTMELTAGSLTEPRALSLRVRGNAAAADYVRGCPGFLPPSKAALAFALRGQGTGLRFYLDALEGAALLVRSPDGIYHCASTREDGIAQQVFEDPLPGDYAVWPAVREAGREIAARILVSEHQLRDYQLRPREDVTAETLQPARHGTLAFDAGAAGGRQSLASDTLRGVEPAASVAATCAGYVDFEAADVTLTLEAQQPTLSLYAESATDTVIMVLDPAGTWHCDDDSEGVNPAVTLSPARPGAYQVLVGAYSQDAAGSYQLWAGSGAPRWSQGVPGTAVLGYEAPPAAGRLLLGEGGNADGERLVLSLAAAGGDAQEVRSDCRGFIEMARPDALLTLAREEPMVTLYAVSGQDTTLVVRGPDGVIHCNDDYEELNPGILLYGAQPGDYAIWVGAYHQGEAVRATLGVTRGEPDWREDRGA